MTDWIWGQIIEWGVVSVTPPRFLAYAIAADLVWKVLYIR